MNSSSTPDSNTPQKNLNDYLNFNNETYAELRIAMDKKIKEEGGLEYGPLIRSKYTADLECLFLEIISNKNNVVIELIQDPLAYTATVCDEKGQAIKKFDLATLLKYANLSHILLTQECYELYEIYAQKRDGKEVKLAPGVKPAQSTDKDDYPHRNYPKARLLADQAANSYLKDLTYAEVLAIFIYTTNFHTIMNAVLRGEVLSKTYCSETIQWQVKDALIHSIMATAGLNKIASIIGCDLWPYETRNLSSINFNDYNNCKFKNSYIIVNNQTLHYVKSDGTTENVTISNFQEFLKEIQLINPENLKLVKLTFVQDNFLNFKGKA